VLTEAEVNHSDGKIKQSVGDMIAKQLLWKPAKQEHRGRALIRIARCSLIPQGVHEEIGEPPFHTQTHPASV
jgi:hypothetical protein